MGRSVHAAPTGVLVPACAAPSYLGISKKYVIFIDVPMPLCYDKDKERVMKVLWKKV